MKKVYVFSGLGVDKRVFRNISFDHVHAEFVDWIKPSSDESMENYAKRIATIIKAEKPILMGLSFGGMIAVEISKIIDTEKVILISSAKTKSELSSQFKILNPIGIIKVLPSKVLKHHNFLTNWFFGASRKEDKRLLGQVLKETDPDFLKWAIHEILNWQNASKPKNFIHIHGSSDRIIPIENVEFTHEIRNGGHFMIMNKSQEIQRILDKAFDNK